MTTLTSGLSLAARDERDVPGVRRIRSLQDVGTLAFWCRYRSALGLETASWGRGVVAAGIRSMRA
jgi:hypothetical protein